MTTRCGYVAVLGRPNAGKSTLLNRMVGAKLAIVTPKAQTTRFRVTGLVMRGESQLIIVDTPGLFQPKRRLDRAMVAAAWDGVKSADIALLLVDAAAPKEQHLDELVAELGKAAGRIWLAFNKIDLIAKDALLPLTERLSALADFERIVSISAANGDGTAELLDALADAMPEGPFLYPEDELTDQPDRMLAAELVREQIFLQMRDEIPYGATVETESFSDRKDGSARIEVVIYVARENHRAILLGAKGTRIKEIGTKARQQLEAILERRVHLFLHVKERAGWDEETARLRALGLGDQ
jgi:GTP-binding protein Era